MYSKYPWVLIMDSKEYLTNKSFCPIPWTGFMYNSNGDVMNCIRSQRAIGNLKDTGIHEIIANNTQIKQDMLAHRPGAGCDGCYNLEQNTNSFDVISDRIFYLKELKDVDRSLYNDTDAFDLQKIDIRWSNVCNFGCVYCGPEYSSRLATELGVPIEQPSIERVQELKDYVFDNAHQLKHVYMAGGEPLLMKENLELLDLLKQVNPGVNLRINTNLSKVDTQVFQRLCEFKNVHWIVSVETVAAEYEYIRHGGVWVDFVNNLLTIQRLGHKISFNMLYFILNYRSIFDCVHFLQRQGFHNNSFIIGALLQPDWLNVRHLPDYMLAEAEQILQEELAKKPGYLLENGLQNVLQYIKNPIDKNTQGCIDAIAELDRRRGLNSREVFKEFYSLIERQ